MYFPSLWHVRFWREFAPNHRWRMHHGSTTLPAGLLSSRCRSTVHLPPRSLWNLPLSSLRRPCPTWPNLDRACSSARKTAKTTDLCLARLKKEQVLTRSLAYLLEHLWTRPFHPAAFALYSTRAWIPFARCDFQKNTVSLPLLSSTTPPCLRSVMQSILTFSLKIVQ